jgi:uncharacterized protein YdhG (YjbR/CyaY superfamily)
MSQRQTESRGQAVANQFETMDDYIASFPTDVQPVLEGVRRAIQKAAPAAEETISYDMPTFTMNGKYLVYFAGWKKHIALYAISDVDDALEKEVARYRAAKGTLQFPLREPMPYDLIQRLVARQMTRRDEARG